jgi:NhaA family Na+:H+ antiporter
MSGRRHIPWFVLDSMLMLPLGCLVALVAANFAPLAYYRFAHALAFWVNDIGLVFFFGVMTRNVVDETLPGGTLHPWRRGLLPAVAAVGGILVPLGIYVFYLSLVAEPMLMSSWAAVCAVDVAASYLFARLIFGRHPATAFLVLLAIVSNAIGLAILAILIPTSLLHAAIGIAVLIAGIVLAARLGHLRSPSPWLYLAGPGVLCWAGLYLAGVHPALALVPVIPFMPHARRDPGMFEEAPPTSRSTLERFERFWAPPVQFVLFFFGLVNGGVPLHGLEAGLWAMPIALLVGRPIGVVLFAALGELVGLHRTPHVGVRELFVIGLTSAMGFTMALFFAAAMLGIGPLLQQMESGGLITIAAGLVAWVAARSLRVGRFHAHQAPHHGEESS